jgi:trigger factor
MNITVTDQENCKKQLRVEIPGDAVRAETDKVATEFARQVTVPGFRPGRVPKSIVKTRFRKELRDEVLSHLLPHSLSDAIREKDLKVIGEPSIENLNFGDDESIDVTFTVEVIPEFQLSNYQSLPLTKRVYKIRDEDVEQTIERLREGQAELVPVEDRGAQKGDIVTTNITGNFEPAAAVEPAAEATAEPATTEASATTGESTTTDESAATTEGGGADDSTTGDLVTAEAETQMSSGEETTAQGEASKEANKKDEEVKQQDVEIELGGKGVLKEFTDALMGARTGDTRTLTVEYPADYKPEQYAGRRLNYSAEVTAVRAKELPEANDEFAQSVGEDFKTIDELRSDIRSKLEHEAEHRTDSEMREALMEQLVDRNQFAVPEFIVEKQIDSRLQMFFRQLANQGLDPRQLKIDWQDMREAQRERAEREVRGTLILSRISDAEKIEVSDEELDRELEQFAASTNQSIDVLRARLTKEGALDSIKEQVRNRKALDLVIASAEIRTEEVEGLGGENAQTGEGGQAEG